MAFFMTARPVSLARVVCLRQVLDVDLLMRRFGKRFIDDLWFGQAINVGFGTVLMAGKKHELLTAFYDGSEWSKLEEPYWRAKDYKSAE